MNQYKKISFLSVSLLLLSFLLLFCACNTVRHDLIYQVEAGDMIFSVRGSALRAKQVVVERGGEALFVKSVRVARAVGTQDGTYGFYAADLNFDGAADWMIATDVEGECIEYLCYLWDAEEGTFIKSEELSGLFNIQVANAEKGQLFAFDHTFVRNKAYSDVPETTISSDAATLYEWIDGKLTPRIRVSLTYYSESSLWCYSVAYYDREAGKFEDSDDQWLTEEEYKTKDWSFLYYYK